MSCRGAAVLLRLTVCPACPGFAGTWPSTERSTGTVGTLPGRAWARAMGDGIWCRCGAGEGSPFGRLPTVGMMPHYWAGWGKNWQKKYPAQGPCQQQRGQRSAQGRALCVGLSRWLQGSQRRWLQRRQRTPAGETDFSTRERLIAHH